MGSTNLYKQLIDQFTDARLLVTSSEGEQPTVEVAHEALLTSWPRLVQWIETVRDDLRLRSQLQRAAAEWKESGYPPAYLWSDRRVVNACSMLGRLRYEPNEVERRFLGPLDPERMLKELEDSATLPEQRALIGVRLALLGDPRHGVGLQEGGLPDIDWCRVPGGKILLRRSEQVIEFDIASFFIARFPVTWTQYRAFLEARDGYGNLDWWEGLAHRDDQPGKQFQQYNNHPADNVSWFDAMAYCRWLSHHMRYEIRLPSEWEWQQAATGGDPANRYPWGTDWDPGRANTYESQLNRTTAVGMYPHGASPVGALDMCGNVWEWFVDASDQNPPDQYCPKGYRALRGGAWNFNADQARSEARNWECSAYRFTSVGFRLACSFPVL